MQNQDIENFFETFAKSVDQSATIYLIGGAATLLMGGSRPTLDVDFAFDSKASLDQMHKAILQAEKTSHIKAEYAEDIERWSMITFLDYKKNSFLYKKFGKVTVKIVEPEYWSIGKMARYYDSDIEDMVLVFKKRKISPEQLCKVWVKALKASPKSIVQFHFKKQAQHFFKYYGKKIWGKDFDSGEYEKSFSFG